MTVATDLAEEAEPFRISQLIYDKRYRSYTIQVVTMMLFMLAVAWLGEQCYRELPGPGQGFFLRLSLGCVVLRHQSAFD